MRFLRGVWRVLVGVKDALVLLFLLLFFGLIYAALSASPNAGAVREGALLLALDGSITEQPAPVDPFALASGGDVGREYRLRDLVHATEAAATDDRIKAVVLDLDRFGGAGQTALNDLGGALDAVRRANKPVLAYATGYTDDGYQLAAHASEVWLNPLGAVAVAGPGGNNLYFKGLLDRLGVTANVYRVGTYKAAVEPFTRQDASPEAEQNLQQLAGALWSTYQDDVRRARPKAQLAAYAAAPARAVASAGGDLGQAALRFGLVDQVGDRTAFGRRVAELAGDDPLTDIPGDYAHTKLSAWLAANPAGDNRSQIGVVTVAGNIVDGDAQPGTAGGDRIARTIRRALDERDLKALVVRIDSGGGSVTASEVIRQAILDAKGRGIPVVASMGSVAASGGYWVATPASAIFAEPSTITGSIGVFGVLPSFQGSLQKLDLGVDGVKTTPLSGEPDVLRGPSAEANQLLQLGVESTYRRFLNIVGKSRRMQPARVDQIAQGRVWDGGTARQIGLVDRFGGLSEAVAHAARLAKLDPANVRPAFIDAPLSLREQLAEAFRGGDDGGERTARVDAFSRLADRPEALLARALADAEVILAGPAIQARCLQCATAAGTPAPRTTGGGLLARLLGVVTA